MGPRRRRFVLAAFLATVAAVGIAGAALWPEPRNFGVVRDGVLYRSGQLTPAAFGRVLSDRSIKTVVTLRPDRGGAPNSDAFEADYCRARGIAYIRIPPRDAGGAAALQPVADAFLAVMADPQNYPVLVHCTAGRDRTGTVCAAYRIDRDGWSPARALAEMGDYGFDPDRDEAARFYAQFVLAYARREPEGR